MIAINTSEVPNNGLRLDSIPPTTAMIKAMVCAIDCQDGKRGANFMLPTAAIVVDASTEVERRPSETYQGAMSGGFG